MIRFTVTSCSEAQVHTHDFVRRSRSIALSFTSLILSYFHRDWNAIDVVINRSNSLLDETAVGLIMSWGIELSGTAADSLHALEDSVGFL